MKNFESIFWVKYNDLTVPATKNLCPGKKFYNEHLIISNDIKIIINKSEFRKKGI